MSLLELPPGCETPAVRRRLFDEGYVRLAGISARYVTGDAADPTMLDAPDEPAVAMSSLGRNGRFANQMLCYAFLRFYGWRNGVAIETPDWPLAKLLGVAHRHPQRMRPILKFAPFEDAAALDLWSPDRAIVEVDFKGHFQEIPASWRAHRALFRRLLSFGPSAESARSTWRARCAPRGTTLVAIHVRRGDYETPLYAHRPQFRCTPIAWYHEWLAAIWPTLDAPRLYVATDDRAAVLPEFLDYAPVDPLELGLPDPISDLLALRSADVLGIVNSSFGRLAALLAPDNQTQVLVDFALGRMLPYRAWDDRAFWCRFGPTPRFAPDDLDRRLSAAQVAYELRKERLRSP